MWKLLLDELMTKVKASPSRRMKYKDGKFETLADVDILK